MKQRLIDAYMTTAETFAELSHARRLHVGAIVVKDDRIISIGYNGMPAGWDNNCEDEIGQC
jgi:dCMP deaminase